MRHEIEGGSLMISNMSSKAGVEWNRPASGQCVSSAESSLTVLSESDQWLPAALSLSAVAGRFWQMSMKLAAASAQCTSATSGRLGLFLGS